jgi:hypothetical protein
LTENAFLRGIFGSPKIREPTIEDDTANESQEGTQTEDATSQDQPETHGTRPEDKGVVPKPVPTARKTSSFAYTA